MKMRKFISTLAVGALLISSMAMSVFASSPSSETAISLEAKAAQAAGRSGVSGEYIGQDGKVVSLQATVSPVDDATAQEAYEAAKQFGTNAQMLAVFDLSVSANDKANSMTIRLRVDALLAGHKPIVLHKDSDNVWRKVPVNDYGPGSVTATFSDLSPVAVVVESASSVATGETLPVMPVVGLICLVGLVFCVSKFKFAK
ncbi:MAG: hypothetical protein K6E30_06480 [Lachnospiraceae bacterium]|nr:hypothetical protein [Lachnospiraceae bacterium]